MRLGKYHIALCEECNKTYPFETEFDRNWWADDHHDWSGHTVQRFTKMMALRDQSEPEPAPEPEPEPEPETGGRERCMIFREERT